MSTEKIKLINIYVVRNREQGWAKQAFTSLELAKQYFWKERAIPYLKVHPDYMEDLDLDFEFDPLAPKSNNIPLTPKSLTPKSDSDWRSIFDLFDDWEIEETQLQLQDS